MFSKSFVCAQKQPCTFDCHVSAPLMRKNFNLEQINGSYYITISALGFYRLFINGTEITKGFLAPYIASPNDYVYYDRYEIASLLRKGRNSIGILLGNGLQNSMDCNVWDFESAVWRSAPKCAFTVEKDAEFLFESDLTVKCHDSAITYDDVRCGERYDATKEIDGWASPDFDDSAWKNVIYADKPEGEAKLVECEPILCYRTIAPINIIKGKKGYIYDFGEINAGVCKMTGVASKGQVISLTHGEIVKEDVLDIQNISFPGRNKEGYIQHDVYTARGGEFTYIPSFTYHGFRYVEVVGITEEQATKEFLTYLVLSSNLKQIGSFTCDNERINKVQECTYRSTRSNFFYFPLDCPQREKNGWTGDTALGAEQFFYNLDVEKSLIEWLRNIRKAQRSDGKLPGIIPTAGWGFVWGNGPGWDLALTEIPYRIYQFSGNIEPARDTAQSFKKYLAYARGQINQDGLASYGLGDWCEAGTSLEDYYNTPEEITDSIILTDICRKMAFLAQEMGDCELRAEAEAFANSLVQAFRKKYIKNGLFVCNETQTAYALALYHNFFEPQEKSTAYDRLKQLIAKDDDHFRTGVLGGRVLYYVLSEMGDSALAIKMITNETFPSYSYYIDRGATTLWEAFYLLDDSKSYPTRKDGVERLISLNHHFWGFVSGWFYSCLAGIKVNQAKISVSPCFDSGLTHVKASHNGINPVEVEWKKKDKEFIIKIKGNATFVAPKGYVIKETSSQDSETIYKVAKK